MTYSKNPVAVGLSGLRSADPMICLDGIDAVEAYPRPHIVFYGGINSVDLFLAKIGTVGTNDLLWAIGIRRLFIVENRGQGFCPLASDYDYKRITGWDRVEVKYPPLTPILGIDGAKIDAVKVFLEEEAPLLPFQSSREFNRALRRWPQDAKKVFLGVASRGYHLYSINGITQWSTPSDRAVAEALVAKDTVKTYTVYGVDSWPSEDPEEGWESEEWTATYRIW